MQGLEQAFELVEEPCSVWNCRYCTGWLDCIWNERVFGDGCLCCLEVIYGQQVNSFRWVCYISSYLHSAIDESLVGGTGGTVGRGGGGGGWLGLECVLGGGFGAWPPLELEFSDEVDAMILNSRSKLRVCSSR